ncbi:hypothetical protein ACG7TL_002465 [Trametes sanguinea]
MSRIKNFFKRRESDPPQAAAAASSPTITYINTNASHGRASTSTDASGLADDLGRLSLGSGKQRRQEPPRHRHAASDSFAGGFLLPPPSVQDSHAWDRPAVPTPPRPVQWQPAPPAPLPGNPANGAPSMAFPEPQMYHVPPPGPLPAPPSMPLAMPVPQQMSRTMQYATTGDMLPPPPPRQDLRPTEPPQITRPYSDSAAFHVSDHAHTSRTTQYVRPGDVLPPPASLPPPLPKQDLRPTAPPKITRPYSDSGAFYTSNHSHTAPSTPQRPHLQTAPNSAPAKPASAGPSRPSLPSIQTPSGRRRSASSPPSPISVTSSSSSGKGVRKVQCCAITKQDKRCTRMVAVTAPFSLLTGEDEPHYCRQHIKNAFIDVKFRSRKDPSIEVVYADWIPEYLQESTKTSLREKMQKEASPADEPGYIYAYEIDDDVNPDVVHIKVGRAVKLTKRLAEWDKQCQSKQTHLLGFWPMSRDAEQNGMMRGRVQVGEPGPYCHRVERLVHLELADLALNAPYLDPDFPNAKSDGGNNKGRGRARGPCPDCGTVHKEIFTFPRATGRYKGKEWQEIVRPVIEKWGGFVEAYV